VVLVTHDPALAAQAERRVWMQDGRIDRDASTALVDVSA
jgi:predicted ABC-type transport system involved in lysophospholipase L1 biosynthesis ATPase subunit